YRLEARNADVFHRNFAGHPHVRVPRVFWSYTRTRVLTLEWLDGTQVADIDVDTWSIEDRRDLAYLMTETWMTMIFRHGFFHGDPHPANILALGGPDHIGLVDFGAVGKLTDDDMSKLTRIFIDAAAENVDALPRRLAELGVRYPKEREEEFLAELRELYYRYYGASLQEIDPLQVIREAFNLIYSMNLRLPTRFLLLDKAIATLGSVGVELYPDFNVFEVAQPYARGLMMERFGPRRLAQRARKESLRLAQVVTEMPYQVHDFLEEIRDGQIEVGFVHKGLEEFMNRMDVVFNRLVVAMIVAGGLIGSSLIGIFAKAGPHLLGINVISVIGFALSGLLGVWPFERGCDDFIARPFDYEELLARIRAVLRRTAPPEHELIVAGPIRVDLATRTVTVCGRCVRLAGKEYELLLELMTDPERVFTKEQLLREVWGVMSLGRTRTVDSHASRLRRKL